MGLLIPDGVHPAGLLLQTLEASRQRIYGAQN
jgi:hypothetical protein